MTIYFFNILPDSGAHSEDLDVRIYDKFCHLGGQKAQAEVGFHSFNRVLADLFALVPHLYEHPAAYTGFRSFI